MPRWLPLFAIAVGAIFLTVVAAGAGSRSHRTGEATVGPGSLANPCGYMALEFDSEQWVARDDIPESWTETLTGTIVTDGDVAVFTAPDGSDVTYTTSMKIDCDWG